MPPVGFKRSRALWDQARRPHTSRWAAFRSWVRAVAYELQPVRASQLPNGRLLMRQWFQRIRATTPELFQGLTKFIAQLTTRQWLWMAGVVVYYAAVRWLHYALDAGPIVLIVTALIAIFTIGLGDNEINDGVSAYSVFNRGFQRLLGELEADELVAQQMGGGGLRRQGPRRGDNNNDAPGILARPIVAAAGAQAEGDNDDANNNADNRDENALDEEPPPVAQANNNNNRARLSGKKARRRRNLEQRDELRRQREAALAMGFGGENDAAALQQLE